MSSRVHKVGREGIGNRFVFCWAPLCLTRVLGLWMFGEGRLIRIHRVRENPRTAGQHLTDEKLSLRDVKQCAKIPQSVTGRASIQTQVSFTPKPFVRLPRPGHSSLGIFPSGVYTKCTDPWEA